MFTGAVTRMTAQRGREGTLPRWLGLGSPASPPVVPILALGATSALLLAAAWTILKGLFWKLAIAVLTAVLLLLMAQGSVAGWVLLASVTAATSLFRKRAA